MKRSGRQKEARTTEIIKQDEERNEKIMIKRSEYRGCVKANVLKEDWDTALAQTKTLVQEQKEQNKVLTVCLYQHKNMLFLYMETLQEGICP